ncbi:MAG: Nif3-like dinuclear metal center hexameric protein, partial [Firmicutes bacterium]|nr:Nif3-like dinuclear metal center hexameric protein [Bacillota bacterium]
RKETAQMKMHQIKEALNEIADLSTQAEWDNSGVQICFGSKNIKKILVAMEINDAVIDEAIEEKADMILTHHPLIYYPVKKICCKDPAGRYIQRLIKADIAVFSHHTPFDKCKGGNTDYLMKLLKLKNIKVMPGTDGYVKTGSLEKAMTLADFAYTVSDTLGLSGLKYTGDDDRKIKNVACCTGNGCEFIADTEGCDVYITGDIRYHDAQAAKSKGMALIDAGHWGSEKIFVPNMAKQLKKKVGSKVKVIESRVDLDPFSYMV